jgi:hypothetical protein
VKVFRVEPAGLAWTMLAAAGMLHKGALPVFPETRQLTQIRHHNDRIQPAVGWADAGVTSPTADSSTIDVVRSDLARRTVRMPDRRRVKRKSVASRWT